MTRAFRLNVYAKLRFAALSRYNRQFWISVSAIFITMVKTLVFT